jgi:threonylcarbamoyladenosine tRNA methylthiotransferase MtaB
VDTGEITIIYFIRTSFGYICSEYLFVLRTMKKVSFKTLGCRLNQYETDALVTQFHNGGYKVVGFDENSDICIINTCTVTNQSDQKSRNIINQAFNKNSGSVIVVSGCMVNNFREILEKNEKITYTVDNEHKSHIFSLVDSHFKGEIVHPDQLPVNVFGFETVDKSLHTRTSIKIQDGCDNYCTFCIIPRVRGRAISRPSVDILDNVRRVLDNGFKEIVITGVNIGRYGHDGVNFENLLTRVLELPGEFRVRISSLEPDGFGPDFPRLFHHPKLTPHLHLCLQSGSDPILIKMRRMYSVSQFMGIVEKFKKEIPDFNLTTDVIVGFPGETDEDFEETCNVVKQAGFSHIHTFRYSRRKGTRAEKMDEHIPEKIKTERSLIIREISDINKSGYYASMKGKQQTVLIEKISKKGIAQGYGEHYIPVSFKNPGVEKNTFHIITLD